MADWERSGIGTGQDPTQHKKACVRRGAVVGAAYQRHVTGSHRLEGSSDKQAGTAAIITIMARTR